MLEFYIGSLETFLQLYLLFLQLFLHRFETTNYHPTIKKNVMCSKSPNIFTFPSSM